MNPEKKYKLVRIAILPGLLVLGIIFVVGMGVERLIGKMNEALR